MKNGRMVPSAKREAAVKRYLAGESAPTLAKELGVSRPGFYNWINEYKANLVEEAKRKGQSAETIDKHDKVDLQIQNHALETEVARLKQKLFELMLESGRL